MTRMSLCRCLHQQAAYPVGYRSLWAPSRLVRLSPFSPEPATSHRSTAIAADHSSPGPPHVDQPDPPTDQPTRPTDRSTDPGTAACQPDPPTGRPGPTCRPVNGARPADWSTGPVNGRSAVPTPARSTNAATGRGSPRAGAAHGPGTAISLDGPGARAGHRPGRASARAGQGPWRTIGRDGSSAGTARGPGRPSTGAGQRPRGDRGLGSRQPRRPSAGRADDRGGPIAGADR